MEISCIEHLAASFVDPDLFQDGLTIGTATIAAGAAVKLDMTAIVTDRGVVTEISGLAAPDGISGSDLLVRQDVIIHIPSKRVRKHGPDRIPFIHDAPLESQMGWSIS